MSDPVLELVHQCPGCFSVQLLWADPDGWECECGERLTRIDLRDSEDRAAALAEPSVATVAAYERGRQDALAEREALREAGRLSRNILIHGTDNEQHFEGEWVAIPREDFDRWRATLAETPKETR